MIPHVLAGWLGALAAATVLGAPYRPADDATVLERLPVAAVDPAMTELRQLRARVSADPHNPTLAARLARRYFELAMAEGDPRYIGYGHAALGPWRGDPGAPSPVLVVRALLRQALHGFDGALDDLAAALHQEPDNVEARSWRAAIFMVRANYEHARRECQAMQASASALLTAGCFAHLEATTGGAAQAYERLRAALERRADPPAGLRLWTLTRLAEIAWRIGRHEVAERHFREALALGVADNYLLAAYCDFLLEQGRARDVLALITSGTRSDTLLLRLALAERLLGRPEAERHARELEARFTAAARRGERLHLQDEARLMLDLRGDARGALRAALLNWETQREPSDARIVLEAALAAREPAAAAPVLAWLERSGFEGRHVRRVATALKALPQ